jgi:hypothetical protein
LDTSIPTIIRLIQAHNTANECGGNVAENGRHEHSRAELVKFVARKMGKTEKGRGRIADSGKHIRLLKILRKKYCKL